MSGAGLWDYGEPADTKTRPVLSRVSKGAANPIEVGTMGCNNRAALVLAARECEFGGAEA